MPTRELTEQMAMRLRAVREALGIEAQEVARHLNISKGAYWQIESGRTILKAEDLALLAEAFDIHVVRLMGLLDFPGVELSDAELAEWQRSVLARRSFRGDRTNQSHHSRPDAESANPPSRAPMTGTERAKERHSRMLCPSILGHSAVLAGAVS